MKGLMSWLMVGILAMLTDASAQRAVQAYRHLTTSPRQPAPSLVVMTGVASWYSSADPGVGLFTASGEPFDDTQLTCANWDLPFGSFLQVTNLETGRAVTVRVNDRGPAKRVVAQGRVIDLSKAAFNQIANLDRGLISIKAEFLPTVAVN